MKIDLAEKVKDNLRIFSKYIKIKRQRISTLWHQCGCLCLTQQEVGEVLNGGFLSVFTVEKVVDDWEEK